MKHKIYTFLMVTLYAVSMPPFSWPISTASAACENNGRSAAPGVEFGGEKKGDCTKETSFAFSSCGTADVGISCLVSDGLKLMSGIVGIAVVGGVVWGGITFSTASGSPAGVAKGKKIIGSSLLGLMLYLLMFAIINFLLPEKVLN